jgi:hypothetical protein
MLISSDNHVFPLWAPNWLRHQIESPDCSNGTHSCLRQLAKWLVIYFADHEGVAARWLKHAAALCDREVPDGEIDRLLIWAEGLFGEHGTTKGISHGISADSRPQADLEEIYSVAANGCRLKQLRESSPEKLYSTNSRNTDAVLDAWGRYSGQTDPLICFGADDRFWTRLYSAVCGILHVHAQIVPSPMRALVGKTADGRLSEHSKDGTGERTFLVAEFDFAKITPRGKPTIWVPLLERTEALGMTVLDLNAALLWQLALSRPLWMVVFSGGKSLQGWFPCRGETEQTVEQWFRQHARRLGACHSTACKSQFVRMPDGTRAPNREGQSIRQEIVYYNPSVL